MVRAIELTKRAEKSLKKAPSQVIVSYEVWRGQIEKSGLEAVQKVSSYHDEPLKGKLSGIRSVRLSRGYRLYYRLIRGAAEIVRVEEVNKHDYKKIERLFGG